MKIKLVNVENLRRNPDQYNSNHVVDVLQTRNIETLSYYLAFLFLMKTILISNNILSKFSLLDPGNPGPIIDNYIIIDYFFKKQQHCNKVALNVGLQNLESFDYFSLKIFVFIPKCPRVPRFIWPRGS